MYDQARHSVPLQYAIEEVSIVWFSINHHALRGQNYT